MDIFNTTREELSASAETALMVISEYLPIIVGALLLLLGGLLVAALVQSLVVRLIKWTQLSRLFQKVGLPEYMKKVGITTSPREIVGKFTYWVVYLVFVIGAFEVLGMTVVVETLNDLLAYLPQVVLASLTALMTLVIARWVKNVITVGTSNLAVNSGIVAYIAGMAVYLFGSVIVLSQLGLDMTIVTANITVIVASAAVSSGFLVAFAGRTVAANVVAGMFVRDYVVEGQKIVVFGKSGKVVSVKRTGIVLKTEEGEEFIPHHMVQEYGSMM